LFSKVDSSIVSLPPGLSATMAAWAFWRKVL
jgi:hypothetical protein